MEAVLTIFNCGRNGSGFSAGVMATQILPSGERVQRALCLINAGDSVQKFCLDNHIKLKLVQCIFVSSLVPHNVSGLPGIILALSSLGVGSVSIIGPHGIKGLLDTMIPFTNRKYPQLDVHEISNVDTKDHRVLMSPYFQLDVSAICHKGVRSNVLALSCAVSPLIRGSCVGAIVACIPYAQTFQIKPTTPELCRLYSAEVEAVALFIPIQSGGGTGQYVCEGTGYKPPFLEGDLMKYFTQLCRQNNMCGIFIGLNRSTDVIEFRRSQCNIFQLKTLQQTTGVGLFPALENALSIYSDSDVEGSGLKVKCAEWCRFLSNRLNFIEESEFASGSEVFMATPMMSILLCDLSGANGNVSLKYKNDQPIQNSISISNSRVGSIESDSEDDSNVYGSADSDDDDDDDDDDSDDDDDDQQRYIMKIAKIENTAGVVADMCMEYMKKSNFKLSANACEYHFAGIDNEELPPGRQKRKREDSQCIIESRIFEATCIQPITTVPPPCPVDSVLTFLGTGCATPSMHRSSSCVLLQIPCPTKYKSGEKVTLVIDAGESCLSQLYNSYAGNMLRIYNTIQSIAIIWISHHHADHHCGLPLLLEEIHRCQHATSSSPKKVLVLAPKSVIDYQEYCACIAGYDHLVDFIVINPKHNDHSDSQVHTLSRGLILKMKSIPVEHCRDSYGLVVHLSNGEKYVYSGDCRPSKKLVVSGENCDLLIHEATFDDSLAVDAVKKRHCTVSEALSVGKKMNAKYVVLTHFSQRYPKSILNDLEPARSNDKRNFMQANDFVRFSFPSQVSSLCGNLRLLECCEEEPRSSNNCNK